MGNKYVYNSHIAPVSCNARDEMGRTLFTKVFLPERIDGTTGKMASTGYTMLTDEEFKQLSESSKTFTHYKDELKLLSVRDDVPPEAKQPHEALADARREAREAKGKVVELEAEIEKLKVRALDAENKLGQLTSASTDEEKLRPLNSKITALTEDLAKANGNYAALRELSKALVVTIGSANKLDDVAKAAQEFIAKSAEVDGAVKKDFE
jgi:predicted  nucleic acid-binding Zn-ribbon protein